MHSLTFTLNGKKHVITGDMESLGMVADALRKARDIPAMVRDLSDNSVSFQHIFQENDSVWYGGSPYTVVYTIPGLDLVAIRPDDCEHPECVLRVQSRRVERGE